MLTFIKNLFNRKRYFILFYTAEIAGFISEGSTPTGSHEQYPSFKEMVEIIKEANKESGFNNVALTNIIELSKKDFERYNEGL